MRREINIRKKKQLIKKKNNKLLQIIMFLIFLLIICFIIYLSFFQETFKNKDLEKETLDFSELNENIPFSIKEIILFSSATAQSGSINQQLILDISQYCDIGIYLNKISDEATLISSLYIDNIVIDNPEIGTPYLYSKKISDLGKCSFDENNIATDTINFSIINTDDNPNHDNYEIYNDGSSPISLGFYNKNVKSEFFPDNSEILYNGTLLKHASIPLSGLKCQISFKLNIITTSNEHYVCNINFNIPFENEKGSIYDTGYITKKITNNETNKFIRIK